MEKIKKGMEVYISDRMMQLNKMFIKKNGPYIVKDVFTAFGVEMAQLDVKDAGYLTSLSDYSVITFPTSELYTKDNIDKDIINNTKEENKQDNSLEEFMKQVTKKMKDVSEENTNKKKYYMTYDNRVVVSEKALHSNEYVLIGNDELGIYSINKISTGIMADSLKHKNRYSFIMSIDDLVLDKVLDKRLSITDEKAKAVIKEELNIKTLNDLNNYDFITHNELNNILLEKIIDTTEESEIENMLRIKEVKDILNKAVDSLAIKMGYNKMSVNYMPIYYKNKQNKTNTRNKPLTIK